MRIEVELCERVLSRRPVHGVCDRLTEAHIRLPGYSVRMRRRAFASTKHKREISHSNTLPSSCRQHRDNLATPAAPHTGALQTGGDLGITGRWMGLPLAKASSCFLCPACATAARWSALCVARSASISGEGAVPSTASACRSCSCRPTSGSAALSSDASASTAAKSSPLSTRLPSRRCSMPPVRCYPLDGKVPTERNNLVIWVADFEILAIICAKVVQRCTRIQNQIEMRTKETALRDRVFSFSRH